MTSEPVLSILTPALPQRMEAVSKLCEIIAAEIGDAPVEHLVFIDNKKRTVGEKRDALLRAARGQYVAYVDDDDMVAPLYVAEILAATRSEPDVITFLQQAHVKGQSATVEFKLGNPNEEFKGGKATIKRNAWHVCAWRRLLAIQSTFPAINYGEDWAYAKPLCEIAKTEVHIAQVLHFYRHSIESTEAPPETALARIASPAHACNDVVF